MRALILTLLLTGLHAFAGRPNVEAEPADPIEVPAPPPTRALAQGRTLTTQFYDGQSAKLWAQAGLAFKRQHTSADALAAFSQRVKAQFGVELRVGSESIQDRNGITVYTRNSVFPLYARGVEIQWCWDNAGVLISLTVRAAVTEAPSPYLTTVIKTQLRLPFEGPWYVLWGGRDWQENPHSSVSDQRFAVDFFIWTGRTSFSGDGSRLEQYLCWGKAVLAPADGQVVIAEDGMADNGPGQVNPTRLYGNNVVIDHGNGEYSLLGHLMKGSISVKVGDRVKAGKQLARTGNSGVSTEPHLHFQLMDNPDWLKAHGMPSVFTDYLADGKPYARGEPRRAMTVAPMTAVR